MASAAKPRPPAKPAAVKPAAAKPGKPAPRKPAAAKQASGATAPVLRGIIPGPTVRELVEAAVADPNATSWVSEVAGRWPGDETEAELLAALRRRNRR